MSRFSLTYLLLLLLSLCFLIILATYYFYNSKSSKLVSPIDKLNQINFSNNQWFPKTFANTNNDKDLSQLTAKSAFFVETQSGKILYQKNQNEKLPIASLTKIMTVIIAMENSKMNSTFVVSKRAAQMEPDKMLLIPGEKLTTEELLDGIFLISANDAAEVFAENIGKNRDEFINSMNAKTKLLGMKDTLFINPTGLEEDNKQQYSTAYDVALMARFAINQWPELLKISSQPRIFLPQDENHQDYDMNSGINLLTTYPGVVGFKTGFTPQAGLTLVTVARKGNKQVLGVILGSTNRRDDAKTLLDYSFKQLGL